MNGVADNNVKGIRSESETFHRDRIKSVWKFVMFDTTFPGGLVLLGKKQQKKNIDLLNTV